MGKKSFESSIILTLYVSTIEQAKQKPTKVVLLIHYCRIIKLELNKYRYLNQRFNC